MNWTVLFSVMSAVLWLASALGKIPSNVWFQAYVGAGGPNQQFEDVLRTLRRQSRLNAIAAFFAALAALTQALGW
ncbi:hypothetical protein ACQR06_25995 [Bradyrhizobium sp. HKCCYLRH1065]|uniref:hypothetical protein n=1 Tax=Bradyrhizobium sp. HKCCYLRH1065 TaxID=3420753 RepID=UPI003EBF0075